MGSHHDLSHLLKFRSSIAVLAMVVALFLVGVSGSWGGPTAAGQAATVTFLDNRLAGVHSAVGPDRNAVGTIVDPDGNLEDAVYKRQRRSRPVLIPRDTRLNP